MKCLPANPTILQNGVRPRTQSSDWFLNCHSVEKMNSQVVLDRATVTLTTQKNPLWPRSFCIFSFSCTANGEAKSRNLWSKQVSDGECSRTDAPRTGGPVG